MSRRLRTLTPCLIALLLGCSARPRPGSVAHDTLDVYVAASLDSALGSALSAYAGRHGAVVHRESGASVELARRITDLHRIPDLLVLADADLFPRLLVPRYARWYMDFATDHMVLAYTAQSRFASQVDSANWMDVVRRPGIEVGRADPAVAPVGYRTVAVFRVAEQQYRRAGLADSLLAAAPARNVRGNASALAALLATGELDYMYDYKSVAQAKGFRYVELPRVPIFSALTIPIGAPHERAARAFLSELFDSTGRAAFASAHIELLPRPTFTGTEYLNP